MKPRKIVSLLCGICAAFCLAVGLLALLVDRTAASPQLMQYQMETWAPPETTSLPAKEYSGIAGMITQYLSGTGISFQYTITEPDGVETTLFHDYEQAHMADCLELFVLCRSILMVSSIALLLFIFLLWRLDQWRQAALGLIVGIGLTLAAVLILVIWGCVDFVSLFLLFHRIAFRNLLWILNPETDLLIRLMPTAFFVSYAGGIALIWLLLLICTLAAGILLFRKSGKPARHVMT